MERGKFEKPVYLFFSLSRKGLKVRKNRGGDGKNYIPAIVRASFGPVSRVVTWLQANDNRFLSILPFLL